VEPGLQRCDLIADGPEPGVGARLGRRADRVVVALVQPVPLQVRRVQPLGRAVVFLVVVMASTFSSLFWVRAEGRGLEPPGVQADWDEATVPVNNVVEVAPGPAVKASGPRLSPRGAQCAVGGIPA
jgi:hypothetical protein